MIRARPEMVMDRPRVTQGTVNNVRIAMNWILLGRRRRRRRRRRSRGRPKGTWRRMVEQEKNELGWKSWAEIQLAKSRLELRSFVRAKRSNDYDDDDELYFTYYKKK